MLIVGEISKLIYDFIKKQNSEVIENQDQATLDFAKKIEDSIYKSIKSTTITIPSGAIVVQTAQGPGTNINPIILNFSTS